MIPHNATNIFSFIKNRVSILEVVQEYTTLKQAGSYWKAPCPFHQEKTASFTISPHKEIFYCFGCHVGGDVLAFVQKIENYSAIEAAHFLAQKYGIDIPETIAHLASDSSQDRNRHYEIAKQIALWCHEQLNKHPDVVGYFTKRGITKESIDRFTLGYLPGGFGPMKQFLNDMRTHNLLAQDLLSTHFLAQGTNTIYSPFENRIIFPIRDHLGNYTGFGGRIFKPDDERPKYYNSKEGPYFEKGSLLFGLDNAKTIIQKTGIAYLVEGYMDCIAMAQHGYRNTIATLGTACTSQHLKQLSRHAQQVYVLFDSDKAGQQAILRLAQLCWQVDLELKVVILPPGQDPASFLAHNESLAPYDTQAQDIFLFYLEMLGNNFVNKLLAEKVKITRKFLEVIAKIEDPLKQDFLIQKASKTFDIPFDSIRRELLRMESSAAPLLEEKQAESALTPADPLDGVSSLEKRVFSAILHDMQLLNNRNEKYIIHYLPDPLRSILATFHANYRQQGPKPLVDQLGQFDEQTRGIVSQVVLEYDSQPNADEFQELLNQLQKKQWKIIVRDLKAQLAKAKQEGDSAKTAELLQDFLELKKTIIPDLVASE